MLFRRGGPKTLRVEADRDEIYRVQEFITRCLKGTGASERSLLQLELVVEELFVNIASYAYVPPETGDVEITCEVERDVMKVILTFVDEGPEFDPLQRDDPDTAAPLSDRQPGGLGIYLVKNSVDAIRYQRDGERNILTVEKRLV